MGYRRKIYSRFVILVTCAFVSMVLSNLVWFDLISFIPEADRELTTIYIGLWAPTFIAMALRYYKY